MNVNAKPMKKKEVGRIVAGYILPALAGRGYVVWDRERVAKCLDELLLEAGLERSGFGRALYAGGCVFPLYVPLDFEGLPGTLGGRSNYLFPGTPAGFEMATAEQAAASVAEIVHIYRHLLIPFLDVVTSSRELLRLSGSSEAHPALRHNEKSWHDGYLLGFVAAYCGEYARVPEFFGQSRRALGDPSAGWDFARLAEMVELERLLDDPDAVRRHLATNAHQTRRLLKLPFPFEPTVYGLPADWRPREAPTS